MAGDDENKPSCVQYLNKHYTKDSAVEKVVLKILLLRPTAAEV
jgi:hypothetical protein